MLDNKKNPARIFSRGRHKSTDVIYVTQRFTQIPKVIRDNCNILAVFSGVDTHTLRNLWQTWCAGDMDYNLFRNFFIHAQSIPHGFVTINLHDPRSRYRIGLHQIFGWNPKRVFIVNPIAAEGRDNNHGVFFYWFEEASACQNKAFRRKPRIAKLTPAKVVRFAPSAALFDLIFK